MEETLQQAVVQQQSSIDDQNARVVRDNTTVDTSRPFRSVKEAVAVFGERLLQANGTQYSQQSQRSFFMQKHETPPKPSSPVLMPPPASNTMQQQASKDDDNNEVALTTMLKKLEAELEDTKKELNELKERESETEIALASLNAELHKNMSKMAEAEAAAAAKAVLATKSSSAIEDQMKKRRESIVRMEKSASLAQLLSFGEKELGYIGAVKKQKKMMKKKPIIPILGDIFSRKKTSSATLHNPLFAASQMYFN